jgi:hypothetical protein
VQNNAWLKLMGSGGQAMVHLVSFRFVRSECLTSKIVVAHDPLTSFVVLLKELVHS